MNNSENFIRPQNILIVGNGFDLAFCLPTKYNHFIDFIDVLRKKFKSELIENNNSNGNDNLVLSFKNIYIEKESKLSCRFKNGDLKKLPDYYNIDNLEIDLSKFTCSFISKLFNETRVSDGKDSSLLFEDYDSILDNEWLKYFLNCYNLNDALWLDFEKEILDILKELNCFLFKYKNTNFHNGNLRLEVFGDLENKKIFHIISFILGSRGVANNNKINKKYLQNDLFGKEYFNIFKILEDVNNSLIFFTYVLKLYFKEIVGGLLNNIKNDLINKENIIKFNKCYSFNYTNTSELIGISNIAFIHGSCINDDRLILGVNLNDFEKNEYIQDITIFTKQFQTLSYINKNINIKNYESKYSHFYIWGLSFGDADRFYLDKLIKLIEVDIGAKLSIFYHNKSAKADYILKLIKYYSYDKVSDLIDTGKLIFENSPQVFKEF